MTTLNKPTLSETLVEFAKLLAENPDRERDSEILGVMTQLTAYYEGAGVDILSKLVDDGHTLHTYSDLFGNDVIQACKDDNVSDADPNNEDQFRFVKVMVSIGTFTLFTLFESNKPILQKFISEKLYTPSDEENLFFCLHSVSDIEEVIDMGLSPLNYPSLLTRKAFDRNYEVLSFLIDYGLEDKNEDWKAFVDSKKLKQFRKEKRKRAKGGY